MTDKRKLSTIRFVFANGTTKVFKNVECINSDERTIRLFIADHTYCTHVFLDNVLYVEEIIDDNSATYCAEGGDEE